MKKVGRAARRSMQSCPVLTSYRLVSTVNKEYRHGRHNEVPSYLHAKKGSPRYSPSQKGKKLTLFASVMPVFASVALFWPRIHSSPPCVGNQGAFRLSTSARSARIPRLLSRRLPPCCCPRGRSGLVRGLQPAPRLERVGTGGLLRGRWKASTE